MPRDGHLSFAFSLKDTMGFKDIMGLKVVKALKRADDGVTFSCADFLCALMQPMHDNYDLRHEQLNKSSLLSSTKFVQNLLDTLKEHIVCP